MRSFIKNQFRICSKVQQSIAVLLMALFFSSFFTVATVYAEKSNEQMAKELLYGYWFTPVGTEAKYSFNEKNLKIIRAGNVNPMGESMIAVSLKGPDGSWTTNNIVCYVVLENNRYTMHLIRRNEKGNEIKGNDYNVKYVKRYYAAVEEKGAP